MAKSIMIQGTMSNAGKSLLCAGLCRIFAQDGYRTAPFKSQNMALNSYITGEGLEMGRAQVVQAQAAGIEPLACMNPILLKPCSDTGSQVIVNGIPVGTMAAGEYFQYKKELVPVIKDAYDRLDREFDIIVIEGAGSPAEINLKQDDIVNMGMAAMAGSPVLLVGDIDRGGVFAQLYGTVMLLTREERARIKGLIINKFRGDLALLSPGVKMIEEMLGIPVVGVTPYLSVDIEDEDSLSSRLSANFPAGRSEEDEDKKALADLAVIRFPRLSNFTDFLVFSRMKGVNVRYVSRPEQLGNPDLIFLPGTKNTMEDLLWLRQGGLEAAVLKLAAAGKPIFGICGGYQMMGQVLIDTAGAESGRPGTVLPGMGLFGLVTEFETEKMRTRVKGRFLSVGGILEGLSGLEVDGYEIHMGRTEMDTGDKESRGENVIGRDGPPFPGPLTELVECQEHAASGVISKQDGCAMDNIYGTYVHGIFDHGRAALTVVEALVKKKGYDSSLLEDGGIDYSSYREQQFCLLADGLRKSLDMEKIYEILEKGP